MQRTRALILSLSLVVLTTLATGCLELAFALRLGENLPEGTRRAQGHAECQDQPCDLSRWLILSFGSAEVELVTPWRSFQSYTLDFASDRSLVLAGSANARHDLQIAVVTQDGALHIAEFGDSRAALRVRIDALGVAWSNGGDRLAVVRRGTTATQRVLEIRTPALDTIESFTLEMTAIPDSARSYWYHAISWNASDTLVAVSNAHAVDAADFHAIVVAPDTGVINVYPMGRSYFMGERSLVADHTSCQPCTVIFDIVTSDLKQRRVVAGADEPISAHAPTGVFATLQSFAFGWPSPLPPEGGLRTETLGPNVFPRGLTPVLIPLEDALPALIAAGFGPEDVP